MAQPSLLYPVAGLCIVVDEKTPEPSSTRRHPREPLETRVDAVIDPGDSVTDLRTGNISEGGVFVAMPEPPPEGSTVTLGMKPVPELPILRLRGEVAWIARLDNGSRPGMGVRFLNVDDSKRSVIRRVIELVTRRRVIPGPVLEAEADSVFPLDEEQNAVPYGVVPGSREPFEPAEQSWFSQEPEPVASAAEELPEPSALESRPRGAPRFLVAVVLVGIAIALATFFLLWRSRLWEPGATGAAPAPSADRRGDVAPEVLIAVTDPVVPSPLAVTDVASDPRGTATAVEGIAWQVDGGQTVVTVTANGTLDPGQVEHQRLSDPPRLVLRLHGVTRADTDRELPVGSPLLPRLRVGLHGEPGPSELHIVFDLGSDQVVVREVVVDGDNVAVQLEAAPP